MKEEIRINLSGHPVAGITFAPLVGVNVDVMSAASLCSSISSVLDSMDSEVTERLLLGEQCLVVLPGMSCLAAVFLAMFHGRFGFFPKIQWAVRGESGFIFTEESKADLSAIRLSARKLR